MKYIDNYMRPRAKREEIDFSIDYDKYIDSIYIDKNRIKQVLINILDNSFKFTNKGGNVKLSAYQHEENVVMRITDNGSGISEEDLPKVKEKFYKGENSKSQNGIGLSICDEIIKLHEGSFEIESHFGEGTTVYVSIPMNVKERNL